MNNIFRRVWAKGVFLADSTGLVSIWLLILAATVNLLRADRATDLRNAAMPAGTEVRMLLKKFTGFASLVAGPTGYTTQQIRHAYGFDQLGATGAGQTIAIVDAYGSPTMQADLDTFCATFNIPSTTIEVCYPQGQTPVNSDWASETSLDVEWAHAIAPGAKIMLVVAATSYNTDLYAAVDYAVDLGATQVSMSWVTPDTSDDGSFDSHFNVPGVTFVSGAGDLGAGVNYPGSSPFVVSVGGTTLNLDSSGNVSSETAWSEGGGGTSLYEIAPSYQAGWWNGAMRGVPDVAYDADPNTGVPVYQTSTGWEQFGGTSMTVPQWAALFALANSLRSQPIGTAAPGMLYSLATANYAGYFHDITSGSNGTYSAGSRYDLVTGLGTPLANELVPALAGGFSSTAAAPVFFPGAGSYSSAQDVTIASATPGATIRYTTNGSTPTKTKGTIYSGPVSIRANGTLKAIAYKSGLAASPVASGSYSFFPQAAIPTFSPVPGTYPGQQAVTISTTTSGASIYYTMDGSTPTETNGTLYSGPVDVSGPVKLQATAYESAFTTSPVASGTYTFTNFDVMYSFTGSNGGGIAPFAGLILGRDGNFYGTTFEGGSVGGGTVFKMTPAGVMTTLVSFDGTNGDVPSAALVQGSDGNFYGTTGGSNLYEGTVFRMTPAGVLTTLVSFPSSGANGLDVGGLIQGADGNFYGVTQYGGSGNNGTVFRVTPAGVLTTLVFFNDANGAHPQAALVQGTDGNFYGTASTGGSNGAGTVFKLTPAGVLTTLVSFTGANGSQPLASLVQGADGNLYGTTGYGGSSDDGVVFKMTPVGVLTTLFSFNDANGLEAGGLVQAGDGNLYGTTFMGGNGYEGTVFQVTPAGVLTTLVSFDETNGQFPVGSLVQGADGNLYGATEGGGSTTAGEIFKVILPSPQVAEPTFSPEAGTYTSAQTGAITSATSGATIRYTTDNSMPSETNGTIYSGSVLISSTTTLKAIAYEAGMTDSTVTSGLYTINPTTRSLAGSSGNGFHALALTAAQAGTFTATFDATPTVSPENAVVGLSKGVATAYGNLSCITRFNSTGQIDAYNGTGYGATTINYSAGVTCHFRLVVNITAHTYSVYVTPAGGSELTVGLNYAFRSTANTVTSLDTWNLEVDATPSGCSLTASNLNP